jgi:hypothetical protein
MKKLLPVMVMFLSCNPAPSAELNTYELTSCDQDKYALIWNMNTADPEWKIKYLEYVGSCLEDTLIAKKLVVLDAEQGNYNILLYGPELPLCPVQNIHQKYPISFHVPAREESATGEFYNTEVEKLMKRDLNVNYDSLLYYEFINCSLTEN